MESTPLCIRRQSPKPCTTREDPSHACERTLSGPRGLPSSGDHSASRSPLTVPLSWNPSSRHSGPRPVSLFPSPGPFRAPLPPRAPETLVSQSPCRRDRVLGPHSLPQRLFQAQELRHRPPFREDLHLPTQRSPRGLLSSSSTLHRKPHVTSVNSTGCTPGSDRTGPPTPLWTPKAQPVLALLPKEYFPCLTTSPQTILELLPDPSAAGRMMDASKNVDQIASLLCSKPSNTIPPTGSSPG